MTHREPIGVLIGSRERVLVTVGRQRNSNHVCDVLEPLVHAVAEHPLASVQLCHLLHSLRVATDGPSSGAGSAVKERLALLVEQLEAHEEEA